MSQQDPWTQPPSAAQVPTSNNERESRSGLLKGVAIGAAAAAVVGTGIALAVNKVGNSAPEKARTTTSDISPDVNRLILSSEAVAIIREFDAQSGGVLADIKQNFVDHGWDLKAYGIYENVYSVPKATAFMQPADILNRNAAKTYFLTSNPNRALAVDQIDVAAIPGSQASTALEKLIAQTDPTNPAADQDVVISSKYFENGYIVDPVTREIIVEAHDTPTWVIGSMSVGTRENSLRVFQRETDESGNVVEFQAQTNMRDDQTAIDLLHVDQIPVIETK